MKDSRGTDKPISSDKDKAASSDNSSSSSSHTPTSTVNNTNSHHIGTFTVPTSTTLSPATTPIPTSTPAAQRPINWNISLLPILSGLMNKLSARDFSNDPKKQAFLCLTRLKEPIGPNDFARALKDLGFSGEEITANGAKLWAEHSYAWMELNLPDPIALAFCRSQKVKLRDQFEKTYKNKDSFNSLPQGVFPRLIVNTFNELNAAPDHKKEKDLASAFPDSAPRTLSCLLALYRHPTDEKEFERNFQAINQGVSPNAEQKNFFSFAFYPRVDAERTFKQRQLESMFEHEKTCGRQAKAKDYEYLAPRKINESFGEYIHFIQEKMKQRFGYYAKENSPERHIQFFDTVINSNEFKMDLAENIGQNRKFDFVQTILNPLLNALSFTETKKLLENFFPTSLSKIAPKDLEKHARTFYAYNLYQRLCATYRGDAIISTLLKKHHQAIIMGIIAKIEEKPAIDFQGIRAPFDTLHYHLNINNASQDRIEQQIQLCLPQIVTGSRRGDKQIEKQQEKSEDEESTSNSESEVSDDGDSTDIYYDEFAQALLNEAKNLAKLSDPAEDFVRAWEALNDDRKSKAEGERKAHDSHQTKSYRNSTDFAHERKIALQRKRLLQDGELRAINTEDELYVCLLSGTTPVVWREELAGGAEVATIAAHCNERAALIASALARGISGGNERIEAEKKKVKPKEALEFKKGKEKIKEGDENEEKSSSSFTHELRNDDLLAIISDPQTLLEDLKRCFKSVIKLDATIATQFAREYYADNQRRYLYNHLIQQGYNRHQELIELLSNALKNPQSAFLQQVQQRLIDVKPKTVRKMAEILVTSTDVGQVYLTLYRLGAAKQESESGFVKSYTWQLATRIVAENIAIQRLQQIYHPELRQQLLESGKTLTLEQVVAINTWLLKNPSERRETCKTLVAAIEGADPKFNQYLKGAELEYVPSVTELLGKTNSPAVPGSIPVQPVTPAPAPSSSAAPAAGTPAAAPAPEEQVPTGSRSIKQDNLSIVHARKLKKVDLRAPYLTAKLSAGSQDLSDGNARLMRHFAKQIGARLYHSSISPFLKEEKRKGAETYSKDPLLDVDAFVDYHTNRRKPPEGSTEVDHIDKITDIQQLYAELNGEENVYQRNERGEQVLNKKVKKEIKLAIHDIIANQLVVLASPTVVSGTQEKQDAIFAHIRHNIRIQDSGSILTLSTWGKSARQLFSSKEQDDSRSGVVSYLKYPARIYSKGWFGNEFKEIRNSLRDLMHEVQTSPRDAKQQALIMRARTKVDELQQYARRMRKDFQAKIAELQIYQRAIEEAIVVAKQRLAPENIGGVPPATLRNYREYLNKLEKLQREINQNLKTLQDEKLEYERLFMVASDCQRVLQANYLAITEQHVQDERDTIIARGDNASFYSTKRYVFNTKEEYDAYCTDFQAHAQHYQSQLAHGQEPTQLASQIYNPAEVPMVATIANSTIPREQAYIVYPEPDGIGLITVHNNVVEIAKSAKLPAQQGDDEHDDKKRLMNQMLNAAQKALELRVEKGLPLYPTFDSPIIVRPKDDADAQMLLAALTYFGVDTRHVVFTHNSGNPQSYQPDEATLNLAWQCAEGRDKPNWKSFPLNAASYADRATKVSIASCTDKLTALWQRVRSNEPVAGPESVVVVEQAESKPGVSEHHGVVEVPRVPPAGMQLERKPAVGKDSRKKRLEEFAKNKGKKPSESPSVTSLNEKVDQLSKIEGYREQRSIRSRPQSPDKLNEIKQVREEVKKAEWRDEEEEISLQKKRTPQSKSVIGSTNNDLTSVDPSRSSDSTFFPGSNKK